MILGSILPGYVWIGMALVFGLMIVLQAGRLIKSENARRRVLDDMQRRHNNNALRLNDPRDR